MDSGPEVTKAVVLARGLGTRMRRADPAAPLDPRQAAAADSGLKAMMPVGRPFLDYALSGLADAGYREACLVIGPEHAAVRDHYGRRAVPRRIRVSFAVQQAPRGTADAVLAAEGFAAGERFIVLNSDNYYPSDALRALRDLPGAGLAAFSHRALVDEGNLPPQRVARFPLVRADAAGRLVDLVDRDDAPGAGAGDEYVSMNCWLFTATMFRACRAIAPSPRGELEVQAAVRYALRELGEPFRVLRFSLPVLDLTHRADVAAVTTRLAAVEVRL